MIKLKNLLSEGLELKENLPPGFDLNDFESMEEFTGKSLMEADDEKLMGARTSNISLPRRVKNLRNKCFLICVRR